MKRHLTLLVCVVMLLAVVFSIASCIKEEPHEHSYVSVETKAPTCTEKGVMTYTCSCNDTYTEEIDTKAHVEDVIPAVAATCEEDGLTEGAKCVNCGTVTKAQETVAKLGHNAGPDATCTSAQVCINEGCDVVIAAALDHDMAAPTCDAPATCKREGCTYTEGVALGHSYSDEEKAPTATSLGATVSTCANCGDSYETPWTAEDYMLALNWVESRTAIAGYTISIFKTTVYENDENGEVISETPKYIINLYESQNWVPDLYYEYTVNAELVDGALKITLSTTLWNNPNIEGDDDATLELGDVIATIDEDGNWVLSSDLVIEGGNEGGDEPGEGGDPVVTPDGSENNPYIIENGSLVVSSFSYYLPTFVVVKAGVTATLDCAAQFIDFANDEPCGISVTPDVDTLYIVIADTMAGAYGAITGSVAGEGGDPTPSIPALNLGDNTVSVTDAWNGTNVTFTATVAGTYYFNLGNNCVLSYDYSNYFPGETLALELAEGQTITLVVLTENWAADDVVVNVSDTEPGEGGEGGEGGNTGSDNYNTTIVIGSNTLYFSADEVAANSADRKVIIDAAGEYKFAAGSLFIQYLVDANGNQIAKNASYYFELPAGEYTAHFAMLSMFGVKADTAQELNVTFIAELPGGGDVVEPECQHTNMYQNYWHELAVDATCSSTGVAVFVCNDCDYYKTEVIAIDENEHDWDYENIAVVTPKTCTVDGEGTLSCTLCDATQSTVLYAGHTLETNTVEATCTTAGSYYEKCTVCDYEDSNVIEAYGHSNHMMTCGDTGACLECGVEFTKEHRFGMWGQATCTEAAYCMNCWQYVGEPLGHDWVNATCGAAGYCSVCEAEGDPATGEHDYDHVVTAPTCVDAGYTTHTCAFCDYSYTDSETAATGEHTWVAPTCAVDGYCFVCEAEGDPATGEHDYDHVVTAPTCVDAGYTTHTCAFCDYSYTDSETAATGEHTWVAPTCTADGYCSVCEAEGDPAKGHADDNGDFKCDACSTKMLPADGTALTIPQALAIAGLAGTSYTTQKYYVTGIIKNVYNTTYGNMYIVDDAGNELCIYGLYSADGKTRYDAMSYKPMAGDEVTVYTVLGMYETTKQGKNAWLDEVVHTHNYSEATCTLPATCVCGETKGEALGHNYAEGSCSRCGSVDPDDEGEVSTPTYKKVTSADELTTGTYVLVVNGYVVTKYDSSGWVLVEKFTGTGDTIVSDSIATWTLTVSGSSVTLKDANGTFIKPKSGNNNGIQTGSYNWNFTINNGVVNFKGTGSDTTILACNTQSSNKIRAYKTSTVSGNPSGYPSNFTIYKLVEN